MLKYLDILGYTEYIIKINFSYFFLLFNMATKIFKLHVWLAAYYCWEAQFCRAPYGAFSTSIMRFLKQNMLLLLFILL